MDETERAKSARTVSKVFYARGNGKGEISPTITGDHQDRITDYTAIVLSYDEETLQQIPAPEV